MLALQRINPIREPSDMMSATEGERRVIEKRTLYGILNEFYSINQIRKQTRGRGSKIPKLLWTSLMEDPMQTRIMAEHLWPRLSRGLRRLILINYSS